MEAADTLPQPATSRHAVTRLRGGQWENADDDLAEEVPVALEYNGLSHAVMMATPADLEAFALGFSLSEGIIASRADCYGIEAEACEAGMVVRIEIAAEAFAALKERRRNLTGRTGCGLCGVDSIDQALRPLPWLAPNRAISRGAVARALAGVAPFQPINRRCGATHAALWCAADGTVLAGFEDVGRHNALDKLIGALALADTNFGDGFVLLTSRASVEMVQKSASVGISALVAMSAPTALAVETARGCGMTLLAFARGADFVVYAHGAQLKAE